MEMILAFQFVLATAVFDPFFPVTWSLSILRNYKSLAQAQLPFHTPSLNIWFVLFGACRSQQDIVSIEVLPMFSLSFSPLEWQIQCR